MKKTKFKSPCGLCYHAHSSLSIRTDNAVIKLESWSRLIEHRDIENAISLVREYNGADMRALKQIEYAIEGVRLTVRATTFRI